MNLYVWSTLSDLFEFALLVIPTILAMCDCITCYFHLHLQTECTEWTKVAQMLLSQLTGNAKEQLFADTIFAASSEKSADLQQNDVTYVGGDNVPHPTLEVKTVLVK